MVTRLFDYFYRRVSFAGAVAIFSTTWSLVASFYGFYFVLSIINFTTLELFYFLTLLMACTMIAIFVHLCHFGLFHRFGFSGFSRTVRIINTHFDKGRIFLNSDALGNKTIEELYTSLSSLSVHNILVAIANTFMVIIVMACAMFVYFRDFEKVAYCVVGGILASIIIGYCTSLITEYFTGPYKVRLQQILFQRSIHVKTRNILSFRIKSIFILILVFSSMIILMILIRKSEKALFEIIVFIGLSLVSVGLLIFLIINTINISLASINHATKNLASGGDGMFFPPFSDKEFMLFSDNYNRAALEINDIRADLESRISKRTEELSAAYEHVNKLYRQIQTDLNLAKRIQKRIMPENCDGIKGLDLTIYYYPMADIGGDIYDIFQMRPGYVRIFLADAIGHGIQAALITMIIKGEYEKVKSLKSMQTLLERINSSFIEVYYTLNAFFSCILVDIDLNHGKIRYASAGHPDQIHICNNTIEILRHTGRLIGIKNGSRYEIVEKDAYAHDKILLYTDGLFEQFNDREESFTERHILALAKPRMSSPIHELQTSIIDGMKEFMGEGFERSICDDITMIGIEIKE
jgi:serine phosphatase RsbU (regulator of sigma subunit)